MAELAQDGGCLTTDVSDPEALADSIYKLATDANLYRRLAQQAVGRKIKTWADYAEELRGALETAQHRSNRRRELASFHRNAASPQWTDIIYPPCQLDKWQMNHSERLAMTAVLASHRPRCSVEIGTYWGGSLSLLAQYSKSVISIDIDPEVRARVGSLANVSFLTGKSSDILPLLFDELDRSGLSVDFVLIDAEHTVEGVQRDIQMVLNYIPRDLLILLVHDSFNPACRAGILEAGWADSPYCQWVDLDFVPGRIVEHDGPIHGELWGGLAMAYFTHKRRYGDLRVHTSAALMFQNLKKVSEELREKRYR